MRDIKFDLMMKNKHTGCIHHKKYYLKQLMMGIEKLFDIENYITIADRQYTGLKDKNGKEIYEGDILETPYEYNGSEYTNQDDEAGLYRGKIHYRPSKGFIQTHVIMFDDYEEADTWSKRGDLEIRSSYTKVIGNIYESPELLEETK